MDLLIGKNFFNKNIYFNLGVGFNFSTLNIDAINEKVSGKNKILPKLKVGIGKNISDKITLYFNYHQIISYKSLQLSSEAPYKLEGYPSQGILSLGVLIKEYI